MDFPPPTPISRGQPRAHRRPCAPPRRSSRGAHRLVRRRLGAPSVTLAHHCPGAPASARAGLAAGLACRRSCPGSSPAVASELSRLLVRGSALASCTTGLEHRRSRPETPATAPELPRPLVWARRQPRAPLPVEGSSRGFRGGEQPWLERGGHGMEREKIMERN